MFFIGVLGSYIVFRSGSARMFEEHAQGLNKVLAGVNTLVLIFSSLTMALAVDAAQKGSRAKLSLFLSLTLLCAAGFMGIKYFEYSDKLHHYTLLAKTDAPLTLTAEPNQTLYVLLSTGSGTSAQYFVPATGTMQREPRPAAERAAFRQQVVFPLSPVAEEPGIYTTTIPAAAAAIAGNPRNVKVFARASAEPTIKDKAVKVDPATIEHQGLWVYDGHVHQVDKKLHFEGWRMPYPPGGEIDIHLVSQKMVKDGHQRVTGKEEAGEWEIDESLVTNRITYGPWKNIFYASYFTLTGVHGLHVVGGIIALGILLLQSLRGRLMPAHTEHVGLYWHFVDLVWIFLFPLLYLI
jgi:cytochrome c oxidase subunit 3